MNFMGEELQPKKEDKTKRLSKILLILIIIIAILIVAIMCVIASLKTEPLKVNLDGQANNDIKKLLVFDEDGSVHIPIRDIAPFLGYESFNGDYLNKSEDTNKCYIEIDEEVVNFEANSNKIEKINPQTMESSYILIDEAVQLRDGKLYTTPQGISKAFNVYYNYDEAKKKMTIQTMQYIVDMYEQNAIELGYKGISNNFNDSKACLKDLTIIQDQKGKYGIMNMETKKEILEAKYDKISYIPLSNEFLIVSNGKMGIKDENGKDKIKIQYEDINLVSQDMKLYVVKQDERYGMIDSTEDVIIPIVFDKIGIEIKNFERNNIKNKYVILDELVPVMRDNKWGLYNINGNQICKNEYDGFGCMISNNKNAKSVLVVPEYSLIIARKDKKYYLVSTEGQELGNSIDFDQVYMVIEAGDISYFVSRNNASANIDKVMEVLDKNNNNEDKNQPSNDDENEQEQELEQENEEDNNEQNEDSDFQDFNNEEE